MKHRSPYTTCRNCGKSYHYSSDTCSHCGLIPYWRGMAEYYRKLAREADATADRLQAEKDREGEPVLD